MLVDGSLMESCIYRGPICLVGKLTHMCNVVATVSVALHVNVDVQFTVVVQVS